MKSNTYDDCPAVAPVNMELVSRLETPKALLIGDPHFNDKNPASRNDDYPTVCLEKLMFLASISHDYEFTIWTGDYFHKPLQERAYLTKLMWALQHFKCPVFSLAGNHDLLHNKLNSLPRTALGILFASGLLKHLGRITLKSRLHKPIVEVVGQSYIENPVYPVPDSPAKIKLGVGHAYWGVQYGLINEAITPLTLKGFTHFLLGHDHVPYDTMDVEGCQLIRPGAMTRGSFHRYNVLRQPRAASLNLHTGTVDYIEIPTASGDLVFNPEKRDLLNLDKQITQFVQSLELITTESDVGSIPDLVADLAEGDTQLEEHTLEILRSHDLV